MNGEYGIIIAVISIICSALLLTQIVKAYMRKILIDKREAVAKKPSVLLFHGVHPEDILKVAETRYRILVRVLQAFVVLVALGVIVYIVPSLRALSVSMLAGAGIAAIILGFAVQKSFSNIFAGIFIALYEPFRIGDLITIDDKMGVVEDITLHHTVIKEWKNKRFIVPNAVIFEDSIENYSMGNERLIKTVEFLVGYETSVDKARKIILEEASKHPDVLVCDGKPSWVSVIGWGEYGLRLRLAVYVEDAMKGYGVEFDLLERVKARFEKAKIRIPVVPVVIKKQ